MSKFSRFHLLLLTRAQNRTALRLSYYFVNEDADARQSLRIRMRLKSGPMLMLIRS